MRLHSRTNDFMIQAASSCRRRLRRASLKALRCAAWYFNTSPTNHRIHKQVERKKLNGERLALFESDHRESRGPLARNDGLPAEIAITTIARMRT